MKLKVKRLFDASLAAVGLIFAAPIMLFIALLVRFESPGPVIFSQVRLGLGGKKFRIHKFRKFPAYWTDAGPGVTTACDVRMTKVGKILERLKLDELPQLWNILKGEMSFVGPRPESLRFEHLFKGDYKVLLDHLPGIFGPNQIAFRNESELYPANEDPECFYSRILFPQKAQRDLVYLSKANFVSDIGCIILGLWVSISGVVNWRRFVKLHLAILIADIIAVTAAWSLAHLLKSGLVPQVDHDRIFIDGLLILPALIITTIFLGSCYAQPVRYFSLYDALRLVAMSSFSLLCGFIILGILDHKISSHLLPLTWFILMPLQAFPRILVRIIWEKKRNMEKLINCAIVIYGVGRQGNALSRCAGYGCIVGFLDDNEFLKGRRIDGYPILGRECDIPIVYEVYKFNEIWVTFEMERTQRERVEWICQKLGIKLVFIPEQEPFARLANHKTRNTSTSIYSHPAESQAFTDCH